jgi:hypothetical protein
MSSRKVSDSDNPYPNYRRENLFNNGMFHKEQQIQNVKFGKLNEGKMSCIGFCCLGIFKNLVYVFILIIVIAFVSMLSIISKDSDD